MNEASFIIMTKSSLGALANNDSFKHGVLTGMVLTKHMAKRKKLKGSGISFKRVLGMLAGPVGWALLAKHDYDKAEALKKQYSSSKPNIPPALKPDMPPVQTPTHITPAQKPTTKKTTKKPTVQSSKPKETFSIEDFNIEDFE